MKDTWKEGLAITLKDVFPLHRQNILNKIESLLLEREAEVRKEIGERVEIALQTYVWDMELGEDEVVSVMENRARINDRVLALINPKP